MYNNLEFTDQELTRCITMATDNILGGQHWVTADKIVIAAAEAIANMVGSPVVVSGVINVTVDPEEEKE